MPADIIGTNVVDEDAGGGSESFSFQHGPIFANIVLADEINRATPKTQSALLEAMQEQHGHRRRAARTQLPEPFFVLATQNPHRAGGHLSRCPRRSSTGSCFKLDVGFTPPGQDELRDIVLRDITPGRAHGAAVLPGASQVTGPAEVNAMITLVRAVPMAPHVVDYAARLVLALDPRHPAAPQRVRRFVRYGPSPRGAQALCLAGRASALLDGRLSLAFRDIREAACPALRHRVLLSLEGEREGVTADSLIEDVLGAVAQECALPRWPARPGQPRRSRRPAARLSAAAPA